MPTRKIKIRVGTVEATAHLLDTPTADAIWGALPLTFSVSRWGKELYGGIPVQVEEEANASDLVQKGDLAYWPPGNAFCIFFGPTPASQGDEARAASAVNVFGQVEGDYSQFEKVSGSATITVETA